MVLRLYFGQSTETQSRANRICCTILAPSFMTAGLFITLGLIVNRLGVQYARLRPKVYSIVFIIADLVALVVQAVGGAQVRDDVL